MIKYDENGNPIEQRNPFEAPSEPQMMIQPMSKMEQQVPDQKSYVKPQVSIPNFTPAPNIEMQEPLPAYTESEGYKNILSKLDQMKPIDNSEELKASQQQRQEGLRNALLMQGANQIASGLAGQYGGKVESNDSFLKAYRDKTEQEFQDKQDQFKQQADIKKQERSKLLEKLDQLKEAYSAGRISRNDSISEQKMLREQVRENRSDEQKAKQDALSIQSLETKVLSDKVDLKKQLDENDPNSAVSVNLRLQLKQKLEANRQAQKAMGLPVSNSDIPGFDKMTAAQIKDSGLSKGLDETSLSQMLLRLKSTEQRDQDLQLKEKAEQRRREGFEFTKSQKDELSDKQLQDITSQDNAIKFIDEIRNYKAQNKIETGQLADKRNQAGQLVNIDDPKVSTFRAMVGQQLADYVKSISGAAVSDQERAILEKLVPKMNDSEATFASKLDQLQTKLNKFKENELQMMKKGQGKAVEALKQSSEEAQSDKVRIQLPDGRIGVIPRENLKKALEKGAKEIR